VGKGKGKTQPRGTGAKYYAEQGPLIGAVVGV